MVNYTARGFGDSCGSPASRLRRSGRVRAGLDPPRGHPLRGARHAVPRRHCWPTRGSSTGQRVGATGTSYGGGQSMALAALSDRMMNADGTLAPWTSPGGKPMRIAGAAPIDPVDGPRLLADAERPHPRLHRHRAQGRPRSRSASRSSRSSPASTRSGSVSGYYAPIGVDPNADLTQWYARHQRRRAVRRQPPDRGDGQRDRAAPLVLLHPRHRGARAAAHLQRVHRRPVPARRGAALLQPHPTAPVPTRRSSSCSSTSATSAGRPRPDGTARLRAAIEAWFDHYVKGGGPAPAEDVTALTQTCPKEAPSGGPFTRPDLGRDPSRRGRGGSFPGSQTIQSAGADPQVSQAVDPISGGGACAKTSVGRHLRRRHLPARQGDGPGLHAARLAARDRQVRRHRDRTGEHADRGAPVGRGARRPADARRARPLSPAGARAAEAFQLHANGWRFAAGHTPKLELLGQDSPYARASNGGFSTAASDVALRLPVVDQPGSAPGVTSPSALPLPAGARLAPGVVRLTLRLRYRKPRRARACWTSVAARVGGQGLSNLRRVDFVVGRKRVKRDTKRAFAATVTRARQTAGQVADVARPRAAPRRPHGDDDEAPSRLLIRPFGPRADVCT